MRFPSPCPVYTPTGKYQATCTGAKDVPYAVFEAVVGCSWKNKVGPPELLDVAQSLELRCVYDGDEKRVQLHMTVNWIIEHLAQDRKTAGYLNTKQTLFVSYTLSLQSVRYWITGANTDVMNEECSLYLFYCCLEHDMINNSIHLH